MSRDWSKVHRQDRGLRAGYLPHCVDGWSATPSEYTSTFSKCAPKTSPSGQQQDFGEYILHLDYGSGSVISVPRLGVWTENGFITDEVFVKHVFYRAPELAPHFLQEFHNQNFHIADQDPKLFLKKLLDQIFIYCDVTNWTFENSMLSWNLYTRKKYRKEA